MLNIKLRPDRNHAIDFEALTLGNNLPNEEFTDSHWTHAVWAYQVTRGTVGVGDPLDFFEAHG